MYSDYGINSTSKIPIKHISRLLAEAYKRDHEDKLWQQWLVDYSRMDSNSFMSFEDYKNKFFGVNVYVDKEQVLKDAEAIKAADMAERRDPAKC